MELLSVFAPDNDILMYGTGLDEKRIGLDELKLQAQRDWSQSDELAFNLANIRISSAGPVAWFASDGQGEVKAGGQEMAFPVRMTAVFVKQDGNWYVTQAHLSLPSGNQDDGDFHTGVKDIVDHPAPTSILSPNQDPDEAYCDPDLDF